MKRKRAWNSSNPLYRYVMAKRNKSQSRSTTAKVTNMARRKKKGYKRSSSNSSLMVTVGAAMAYGALRKPLSNLTAQYIPSFAGQYTDEVALGVLGWYLSKKGGVVGALGRSALIIESASVGNQLVGGMIGSTTSVATANQYSN